MSLTPEQVRNANAYNRAIEEIVQLAEAGTITGEEAAARIKLAENTYKALEAYIVGSAK
jgi:hypothetical protein